MKSITLFIEFKNGFGQISEHHLKDNVYFAKSEMIKWLKNKYKNTNPIKNIREISHI